MSGDVWGVLRYFQSRCVLVDLAIEMRGRGGTGGVQQIYSVFFQGGIAVTRGHNSRLRQPG